ncbi:L-arabinokinase [Senna tora]|uniref:L-arabinokinase n=1 Tax=Senna tora TaxID=362788 RepID=A0A834U0Q5_9FABA|nr:L-arabinokinase [Senna tora]
MTTLTSSKIETNLIRWQHYFSVQHDALSLVPPEPPPVILAPNNVPPSDLDAALCCKSCTNCTILSVPSDPSPQAL